MHPTVNYRKGAIAILCCVVTLLVLAEVVARFAVPRVSRLESRTVGELRAAAKSAPATGSARSLIIAGNSLLLESVSIDSLNETLSPQWRVGRLAIESTAYLDWYYGLRNLLASGSRPTAIALMLSPEQLVSDSIRGSYSAHRLFSATDSIRAGAVTGGSLTELANLWFSHFSAYFGLRAELRQQALRPLGPHFAEVLRSLAQRATVQPHPPAALYEQKASARFRDLQSLCNAYGIECMFICAPLRGGLEERQAVLRAADSVGLAARELDISRNWAREDFQADGFHMSPDGSAKFTSALGSALRKTLARE